jgi:TPR repeat protein
LRRSGEAGLQLKSFVTAALTISLEKVRETGSDSKTEGHVMGTSYKGAAILMERQFEEAARGDAEALYELGVVYSTGTHGMGVDLVEAHKWFNLAALNGSEIGQECRAEIAEEMSAREIAEAQRQARAWLSLTSRRAA